MNDLICRTVFVLSTLFIFDVSYIGLRLYLDKKRRKAGR